MTGTVAKFRKQASAASGGASRQAASGQELDTFSVPAVRTCSHLASGGGGGESAGMGVCV